MQSPAGLLNTSEGDLAEESRSDVLPHIAVLVLNWNARDDTVECLRSLSELDYPAWQAVVVDNGSTDGSFEAIRAAYPDATVLQAGRNLGYAGGNNLGLRWIRRSDFDYVLVLNNDTVVPRALLTDLVSAARDCPQYTILSPRILYHSRPDTLWFSGSRWNETTCDIEHVGDGSIDDGRLCTPGVEESPYACGCALFFPVTCLDSVGYLEERFFLVFEDTDWCFRAAERGLRCGIALNARVWHKVSSTIGNFSPLGAYFYTRNRLLWAERHLPWRTRFRMLAAIWRELCPPFAVRGGPLPSFPERVLWSLTSYRNTLRRRTGDPVWLARVIGLRDYVLRRFGDCPPRIRALRRIEQA